MAGLQNPYSFSAFGPLAFCRHNYKTSLECFKATYSAIVIADLKKESILMSVMDGLLQSSSWLVWSKGVCSFLNIKVLIGKNIGKKIKFIAF
jgi:hypothetical protein